LLGMGFVDTGGVLLVCARAGKADAPNALKSENRVMRNTRVSVSKRPGFMDIGASRVKGQF